MLRGREQAASRHETRIARTTQNRPEGTARARPWPGWGCGAGRDQLHDSAAILFSVREPCVGESVARADAAEDDSDQCLRTSALEEEHDPAVAGHERSGRLE